MHEYFLISHINPLNRPTYNQRTENLLAISSILSGITVFSSLRNNTSFYGTIIDVTKEGFIKVKTDFGIMEMESDLILFQTGMQLEFAAFQRQDSLMLQLLKINNESAKHFLNTQKLESYGSEIIKQNIKDSIRETIFIDIGNTHPPKYIENIRNDYVNIPPKNSPINTTLADFKLQTFKEIIPENEDPTIVEKIIFDIAKNTDVPELIAIMAGNPDNQDIKRLMQVMRQFINISIEFSIDPEHDGLETNEAVTSSKRVDNNVENTINPSKTKSAYEVKLQKQTHDNMAPNVVIDHHLENEYSTQKTSNSQTLQFKTNVHNNIATVELNHQVNVQPLKDGIDTPLGFIKYTPEIKASIMVKNSNYNLDDIKPNNLPAKLPITIQKVIFEIPEKKVSPKIEALEATEGFKTIERTIKQLPQILDPLSTEEYLRDYDEDTQKIIKLICNIPNLNKKSSILSQVNKFISEIKKYEFEPNNLKYSKPVENNNFVDVAGMIHELDTIKTSMENSRETKEWQVIPLPIIYNSQVMNLNFYVQNEREHNQASYERPSKTLFKIEITSSPLGVLTIDGNIYNRDNKKFLDLSLYAEKEIPKDINNGIRDKFKNVLEALECDGRLKILSKKTFDQNPKSFIKNLLDNIRA